MLCDEAILLYSPCIARMHVRTYVLMWLGGAIPLEDAHPGSKPTAEKFVVGGGDKAVRGVAQPD